MQTVFHPSVLGGEVNAIPSKSCAHRILICAALAEKPTEIYISDSSDDIEATINVLSALGAKIRAEKNLLSVTPIGKEKLHQCILDCNESGSTLRFLLPVAGALGADCEFIGRGRLPERPLIELVSQMKNHGISFSSETLPFKISGKLSGGDFCLPGNVSSQYITGILLALPIIGGGRIKLSSPAASKNYIDITTSVLKKFSVDVDENETCFTVKKGFSYSSPGVINVEGDWSNAAVWLCAGALSEKITVKGLDLNSMQGDKMIPDILSKFGAKIEKSEDSVSVSPGSLCGTEFDAENIPDIVPVLSIVAAAAKGTTKIKNIRRLRLKESDRVQAVLDMLAVLGADAEATENELIIKGTKVFKGGHINTYKDHRMVMSAALASVLAAEEITISDLNSVNKSYPGFIRDFKKLGGNTNV